MAQKQEVRGLVEQIKEAVRRSGQSLNALSKISGLDSGQLSRFMRGQRSVSLEAAEKLCNALHLHLAQDEPEAPSPEKPKARGLRGKE